MIGTQMVTKGLDFENVTLVGVLSADQSLYTGNFRSGERTFSLITQVPAELQDGKLVSSPSTEFLSPEFSFTLLQDGMISMDMLGGGEVLLSVVFAPVTEAAAE